MVEYIHTTGRTQSVIAMLGPTKKYLMYTHLSVKKVASLLAECISLHDFQV